MSSWRSITAPVRPLSAITARARRRFLRTLVDSLKPLSGEVRWGYGCQVGIYAQHVYSSLPESQTVLEYLYQQAAYGKKDQEILEVAGTMLFRGPHVKKPIPVLSGGERARLCLAGLLLSDYNVLVLDEPANHLDVDTVDALAEALTEYAGTVIFTSHDRHFTKRVASCIVEVRDGRVTHYSGQYEAYVYKVNQEIEAGERELATQRIKLPPSPAKPAKVSPHPLRRNERLVQKELKTLERLVAQLDEQKRSLNAEFLNATDASQALRLHNEVEALTAQLAKAEERWCRLQEEIDGAA